MLVAEESGSGARMPMTRAAIQQDLTFELQRAGCGAPASG